MPVNSPTTIPTKEPSQIVRGDAVSWIIATPGFEAPTYEIQYAFVKTDSLATKTSADNGDGRHLIAYLSAETLADFTEGEYHWQMKLVLGAEEWTYSNSITPIEVIQDFASQSSGFDARLESKKHVDKLTSVIYGKADVGTYSINNRSLSRFSPEELRVELQYWRGEYAREVRKLRRAKGLGTNSKIQTRFRG